MNVVVDFVIEDGYIIIRSDIGEIRIGTVQEKECEFIVAINGEHLCFDKKQPLELSIHNALRRYVDTYKNKRVINLKVNRVGDDFFVAGAKVGFSAGNELYVYDNRRELGFRCISTTDTDESKIMEEFGKNYGWHEIDNQKHFLFHESISNPIGTVSPAIDGMFLASMPKTEDKSFINEQSAIDFVESAIEDKSRNFTIEYHVKDGEILTPSGAIVGVVEDDGAIMLIDKSKRSGYRLIGFGDPVEETERVLGNEVRFEGGIFNHAMIGWIEIGTVLAASWPVKALRSNSLGGMDLIAYFGYGDGIRDARLAAVYGLHSGINFSSVEIDGFEIHSMCGGK